MVRTVLDTPAVPPIMLAAMLNAKRWPMNVITHGLAMLCVFQTIVGRTARG
jgi:hypothetical protein